MSTSGSLETSADLETSRDFTSGETGSEKGSENNHHLCDVQLKVSSGGHHHHAGPSINRSPRQIPNTFTHSKLFGQQTSSKQLESHRRQYSNRSDTSGCRDVSQLARMQPPVDEVDFYEEVDERMSRNSYEYPEQQAKCVGNWLDNMVELPSNTTTDINDHEMRRYDNDTESRYGKVIGIRGFRSSMRSINDSNEKELRQQRAKFNKLKFDHHKLQSDHEKLQNKLQDTITKFKRLFRKKEYDIEVLKALMERRSQKMDSILQGHEGCQACQYVGKVKLSSSDKQRVDFHTCNPGCGNNKDKLTEAEEDELDTLRLHVRQLELKLANKDKINEQNLTDLRSENERLTNKCKQTRDEYETEVKNLRHQVELLTLEPSNRSILSLRNENNRLKDLHDAGLAEFQTLKDNYNELELKYKSMIDEQDRLDGEKNEERSKLMVELCRLQVYHSKLETILQTEREIKLELQNRIEKLENENIRLKDQLKVGVQELTNERIRSKKDESIEVEQLLAELARWKEKFYRLEKDKLDSDDLVRAFKGRLAQLDQRNRTESELVNERNRAELEKTRKSLKKSQEEGQRLCLKLEEFEAKLVECDGERGKMFDEVLKLTRELELASASKASNETNLLRLKESQERATNLANQLTRSETRNREISKELDLCKDQLELCRQQLSELKQKFRTHLEAYDELKERKEKELARLRGSLNFEQYNRQVALKGIEKELRVSLKELESIKSRFSRRLAKNDHYLDGSGEEQPRQEEQQQHGSADADRVPSKPLAPGGGRVAAATIETIKDSLGRECDKVAAACCKRHGSASKVVAVATR